MTIVVFYKNGFVQATTISSVVIEKNLFKFLKEKDGIGWGEIPLEDIKKIVVDGVTVWEEADGNK